MDGAVEELTTFERETILLYHDERSQKSTEPRRGAAGGDSVTFPPVRATGKVP